jgi:RNA polymerase sigma factor (sigma-70 family)
MVQYYLNTMRWVTASREDAQDLSQDCLLALWQAEQRAEAPLSDALRYTICKRQMQSMVRRERARAEAEVAFDLDEHDVAGDFSAEDDLIRRDLIVKACNDEFEAAVALYIPIMGLSAAEAADYLGCSESTVRRTMARLCLRIGAA